MSIFSIIAKIKRNIAKAYDILFDKGVFLPKNKNSANLPATINKILETDDEWVKPDDWPDLREIYKEEIPEKYKNAGAKYKVCYLFNNNKPRKNDNTISEFLSLGSYGAPNAGTACGFQIGYYNKNKEKIIQYQDGAAISGGKNSIYIPADIVDFWWIVTYNKTNNSASNWYPTAYDAGYTDNLLLWWYSPDTYKSMQYLSGSGSSALQRIECLGLKAVESAFDYIYYFNCSLRSIKYYQSAVLNNVNTAQINLFRFVYYCNRLKKIDVSHLIPDAKPNIQFANFSETFLNAFSLEKITSLEKLNFSPNGVSLATAFNGSFSLKEIDFSVTNIKPTTFSNTFNNAFNFRKINLSNVDLSLTTSLNGAFVNLYFIKDLDLSGNLISNTTFNNTFSGCKNLVSLNLANSDVSKVTSFASTFYNCCSLQHFICSIDPTKGPTVSVSFSQSHSLTYESLINIIQWLGDQTGLTTQTLTLSTTSKTKLSTEEIAIAVAKNWTVA